MDTAFNHETLAALKRRGDRFTNGRRAPLTDEELAEFAPADTGREDYLAWAAGWKASYAELASEIRALRADTRAKQRAGDPNASYGQAKLVDLGRTARNMCALRRLSKRLAGERMTAARAALTA